MGPKMGPEMGPKMRPNINICRTKDGTKDGPKIKHSGNKTKASLVHLWSRFRSLSCWSHLWSHTPSLFGPSSVPFLVPLPVLFQIHLGSPGSPGSSWLSLDSPGSSGSSWLLLTPLAPPGFSWPSLAPPRLLLVPPSFKSVAKYVGPYPWSFKLVIKHMGPYPWSFKLVVKHMGRPNPMNFITDMHVHVCTSQTGGFGRPGGALGARRVPCRSWEPAAGPHGH